MAYQAHMSEIEEVTNSSLFSQFSDNKTYSHDIVDKVNSFFDSGEVYLAGKGYDEIKIKMKSYSVLMSYLADLNELLSQTIAMALLSVAEYMGNDISIDSNQLPELYAKRSQIAGELYRLQQMSIKDGDSQFKQNINNSIATLMGSIKVLDEKIAKIEGLEAVLRNAAAAIDEVIIMIDEVNVAIGYIDSGASNGLLIAEENLNLHKNPILASIATVYITTDMLINGAAVVAESFVDAAALVSGGAIVALDSTLASILSILGQDAAANYWRNDSKWASTTFGNFIATNHVAENMVDYYENDWFGQLVNNYSYYSYDSEFMRSTVDDTAHIVPILLEMHLGVNADSELQGQLNAALLGGAISLGGQTQRTIASMNDNPHLVIDRNILLSTMSGAMKARIAASAGQEIAKTLDTINSNGGLNSYMNAQTSLYRTQGGGSVFRGVSIEATEKLHSIVFDQHEQADILVETALGAFISTADDAVNNNTSVTVEAFLSNLGGESADQLISLRFYPYIESIASIINDTRQAYGADGFVENHGKMLAEMIINSVSGN